MSTECSLEDFSWAQNVEECDILIFQDYLPTLMTVFGLNQDAVAKFLGLSRAAVSFKIGRSHSCELSSSEYVYIRLWMQTIPNKNRLQQDALHYLTRKPPHDLDTQKKIDEIVNFVANEKARYNCATKKATLAEKIGKAWEIRNG